MSATLEEAGPELVVTFDRPLQLGVFPPSATIFVEGNVSNWVDLGGIVNPGFPLDAVIDLNPDGPATGPPFLTRYEPPPNVLIGADAQPVAPFAGLATTLI